MRRKKVAILIGALLVVYCLGGLLAWEIKPPEVITKNVTITEYVPVPYPEPVYQVIEKPVYIDRTEYITVETTRTVYVDKLVYEVIEKTVYINELWPFANETELREWVSDYLVPWNELSDDAPCYDYAYAMMRAALDDGFLMSTELILKGEEDLWSKVHMVCSAPVSSPEGTRWIYFVDPRSKRIFREIDATWFRLKR